MVLLSAVAAAATLHVGVGQPYATVQDAIGAAVDGDIIAIDDGVYDLAGGDTVLPVSLTLRGQGASRVRLENASLFSYDDLVVTGVTLAPDVTVRSGAALQFSGGGLEVRDVVFDLSPTQLGMVVHHAVTLHVEGCSFRNGSLGLAGVVDGDATVMHNRFDGFHRQAVWFAGRGLAGGGATSVVFEGNTITHSGARAVVHEAAVELNEQTSGEPFTLTMRHNRFCGGMARGAKVGMDVGALVVEDNLFVGNRGNVDVDGGGLVVVGDTAGSATAQVHNNTFWGNQSGVWEAEGHSLFVGEGVVADVQNNVFGLGSAHATEVPLVWDYNATQPYWETDTTYTATAAQGPGGFDVPVGDPLFVSPSLDCLRADFSLAAGSAAIDGGNSTMLDADGSVRDVGARPR